MLKAYWEATGSNDLTDILSGGEYWLEVSINLLIVPFGNIGWKQLKRSKKKDHHP
jgi:hypothetical protein